MNKEKIGSNHFNSNKNCAQSVLMTFADEIGISAEQAFSLAAGFGGGIAGNGSVCGAVTGAIMVLGLKYGQPGKDPDAAKVRTAEKVNEFLDEFKKLNKSINCRDIIHGIDLRSPDGPKEWTQQNMNELACTPAVISAIKIITE